MTLAILRGRVIIKQDSSTLFGKTVDYNFETKVAEFTNGIRLEDSKGTLIAKMGTTFKTKTVLFFRYEVQLNDSSQYAEGDSLFINRKRNYLQIYSNVFISDDVNTALLTGEYVEADSTGKRYTKDDAYLMKFENDSTNSDTTHIFADEILLLDMDSTSTIEGIKNVTVWTPNSPLFPIRFFYDSKSEIFTLNGSPRSWNKQTQLTGPYIIVELDSSEIKQLSSFPNAFSVQKDTVTTRLNQLKGDTLMAYFDSGISQRLICFQILKYYIHTKNDDGDPDGAIENTSPTTTLLFEDGELMKAIMGQNEGFSS